MVIKKKGVLCGLFLVLVIMLGLSLNASSDVNALSYGISNFMISNNTYRFVPIYDNNTNSNVFGYFTNSNQFPISFTSSNPAPSGFTYPHTWTFKGDLVTDNGSFYCQLPALASSYYNDGVSGSSLTGYNRYYNKSFGLTFDSSNFLRPGFSPFYSDTLGSSLDLSSGTWLYNNRNALCFMQDENYYALGDNIPPASRSIPSWNWSSLINIPLVNNRFEYEKSKPFTYQYNTINLRATEKVDGVVSTKDGLAMSDIFGTYVYTFGSLGMEFGLFDDITGDLSDSSFEGFEDVTTFSVKGSIEFDSTYTLSDSIYYSLSNYYDPYFDSSLPGATYDSFTYGGKTVYDLTRNSHSSSVDLKQCSVQQYHSDNGDDSDRVDFECVYDPSSDGAIYSHYY